MNEVKNQANHDVSSPTRASMSVSGWIGVTVVMIAAVIAMYALLRNAPHGQPAGEPSSPFQLDLTQHLEIPANQFGFSQQATYPLSLSHPVAIAVGPKALVYVGGDRSVAILTAEGQPLARIDLEDQPTCVAVADDGSAEPGRLFVGVQGHVVVYDSNHQKIAAWAPQNEKSLLTGMAVANDELFVADAGNRVVSRYDAAGKMINQIGASSPDRDLPGFVIPSPCFDLVVGLDGTLHVANTGMRRIESYSFDGQLQSFWGEAGSSLPKFFGCCNPAQLAILPDGRFVTSEKGIPRVKVYSAVGEFESVVAGPAELDLRASDLGDARDDEHQPVYDIAVDQQGRVLVLDPRKRCIRVFAPTKTSPPAADLSANY